jgi:hypothetical protein
VITQHSFSIVPEGNPLRRRYTVTADRRWDDEDQRAYWVVRCGDGYIHDDMCLYDEPRLFEEQRALAVAEEAAGCVRLWTRYGEFWNAQEAMEAGLR